MRDILSAAETLLGAYSFRSRNRGSELRRSWRPPLEGIAELVAFFASNHAVSIQGSEYAMYLARRRPVPMPVVSQWRQVPIDGSLGFFLGGVFGMA